jgi:ferredoxin
MRIVVDYNRCTGNAVCVAEAPDLFDISDDGEVILNEQPDQSHLEAARRAAYMCPNLALTVEDSTAGSPSGNVPETHNAD